MAAEVCLGGPGLDLPETEQLNKNRDRLLEEGNEPETQEGVLSRDLPRLRQPSFHS
jgi:hypothetical protein